MLCRLHMGPWVERITMVCVTLYQFGCLWSYISVFSSSLAATVPMPWLGAGDPCDMYRQGDCQTLTLYYFWALAFAGLMAALLGFETAFKHLDGHSVHVKRSGVTKPGQVLRIKGEGMPKHGTPSEFGDLLITFTVDFPKSVEGALADGLESLLPPFSKTDIRIFQ